MNRIKNEPAVIIGFLATAALAAQGAVGPGVSWRDAIPLVAAAVIRQFVTPATPA